MGNVRVSVSLPQNLLDDLSYVADRIGITRSALLSQMVSVPVSDMRAMLDMVPESPTEQDIKRARGKSQELIEQRVQNLEGLKHDLFSG